MRIPPQAAKPSTDSKQNCDRSKTASYPNKSTPQNTAPSGLHRFSFLSSQRLLLMTFRHLLSFILLSISVATAQLPVTNGLVAHWDFEGDDINNQGNAALNGTPMPMNGPPDFSSETRQGSSGTSREFDGSDQYINVDNPVLANFDSDYTCLLYTSPSPRD